MNGPAVRERDTAGLALQYTQDNNCSQQWRSVRSFIRTESLQSPHSHTLLSVSTYVMYLPIAPCRYLLVLLFAPLVRVIWTERLDRSISMFCLCTREEKNASQLFYKTVGNPPVCSAKCKVLLLLTLVSTCATDRMTYSQ